MSGTRNKYPTKNGSGTALETDENVQHIAQEYSGPIPPPSILKGFNDIVPGAADRILAMAEENSKHQIDIEKAALNLAGEEVKRGQIFALVITVSAFITCVIALLLGSEETAMTIGGTTIIGLVSAFIFGRYKKSDN